MGRVFCILFLVIGSQPTYGENTPPIIKINGGRIRGIGDGELAVFKGIPYAEAPTGSRRWRPPVAKRHWSHVLSATAFPPPCPQTTYREAGPIPQNSISGEEDCLYLNVWAPIRKAGEAPLPVMVFIHGGGNATGSTTETWGNNLGHPFILYNGAPLARDGRVIVVTIQYRLGILGNLALPDLVAEEAGEAFPGTTGNYGKLDQVLALKWVQANAEFFGGNPKRVTIFGESAGAYNVCSLLASPLAKGLFTGAILQSGGCDARTSDTAFQDGENFAKSVGCDGAADSEVLECLREKTSLSTILEKQPPMRLGVFGRPTYLATIDGYFLKEHPLRVMKAGKHNRVPVILGSNSEEMEFFFLPAGTTAAEELSKLEATIGRDAFERLQSLYPASEYGGSQERAASAATTDIQYTCPMQQQAVTLSRFAPVYGYYYRHWIDGTAKITIDATASATVSSTITISGPFGNSFQIAKSRAGAWTENSFSESHPLPRLMPMHGLELPLVFQRWPLWEKALGKFANDQFAETRKTITHEIQARARAKLMSQGPVIAQQMIEAAVESWKNEVIQKCQTFRCVILTKVLFYFVHITNTPPVFSNVSVKVTPDIKLSFNKDEREVQRTFLRHWSSFAHFQSPQGEWRRLNRSSLRYLEIDETAKVRGSFKREECAFINRVFPERF